MSKISVNSVDNANIYIYGVNMLGRAGKIKLGSLEAVTVDHEALGMVGEIELPVGFKKLQGEIEWNAYYWEVARLVSNPFNGVPLMCRQNVKTFDSNGLVGEKPLVTLMTATFTSWPLGDQSPRKKAEYPSKFSATYVQQIFDGIPVIEVDYLANVFRWNMIDQLWRYRANIGG